MRIHHDVSCRPQIPIAIIMTPARLILALMMVGTCLQQHPSVEGTPLLARDGLLFPQKHYWGHNKRNGVLGLLLNNNRLSSMHSLEVCRLLGETFRGGSQETAKKVDKKKPRRDNKKEEQEKEEEAPLVQDKKSEDDEIEDDQEENGEEQEEENVASSVELEESTDYDEPLVASHMLGFYITIGIMVISQKIDLFNPLVVRATR
jgi:hypothetical protein